MKNLSLNEIREAFLNYFKKNDHKHLPSSSLVPENDATALFANSGMFQFKNIFTGKEKSDYKNCTTSQKCLRVGGKHNDLENVGYTARHHTFFEMLGNFSFGGYFKEEAISYAWNFLTKELMIPAERLIVTVYYNDFEAIDLWKKIAGLSDEKIIKISTKDNFWEMGESGPCGPCSEIFYDYGDSFAGGLPGSADEDLGERYIEIWNLVFMQFERVNGELFPLPVRCIDTGMGLERISAVCQNVHDNYQIDLFKNLIDEIKVLSGLNFKYEMNDAGYIAARVAADHIRSACFLISESVFPGNNGREYVLKRIIRRALIFLYKMNIEKPILSKLSKKLVELMGKNFPELKMHASSIESTIKAEEESFLKTIKNGMVQFEAILEGYDEKRLKTGIFSGEDAFKLYDTFGFPIDLTADMCMAHGLSLDEEEFEKFMSAQKELAKKSWKGKMNYGKENHDFFIKLKEQYGQTKFVGYEQLSLKEQVIGILDSEQIENDGESILKKTLVFSATPIYFESGGQMSDSGLILMNSKVVAKIINVKKYMEIILHECEILSPDLFNEVINGLKKSASQPENQEEEGMQKGVIFNLKSGANAEDFQFEIRVDLEKRKKICANHTGAHLLHAALKAVVGPDITQKGSSVSDEKLRFDFNHNGPVPQEKLKKIEEIVNLYISKGCKIKTSILPREEALKTGAMALFDEKYSEFVRVVGVEDASCTTANQCFSLEFCGGTHVENTFNLMAFKIVSEEAVASGVRRIEALTGLAAFNFVNKTHEDFLHLLKKINIKQDAFEGFVQNLIKKNKENEAALLGFEKKIFLGQMLVEANQNEKDISEISVLKLLCTKNHLEFDDLNDCLKGEDIKLNLHFFGKDNVSPKIIREACNEFCDKHPNSILFVASNNFDESSKKESAALVIFMSQNLYKKISSLAEKVSASIGCDVKNSIAANIILADLSSNLEIRAGGGSGFFASNGHNACLEYEKLKKAFLVFFS